jgi:hypothetical protein
VIKVVPSEGATLDELALREREGTENTRPLDVRGIELSGQQAYETIFFDYGENSTRKAKSTFSIMDGQVYIINFVAEPSKYEDYLPMVDEMIKSFRIDEVTE